MDYGANGTAASAQRAATDIPASHVNAAYINDENSTTTGKSKDISVPIESSAGYVAGLINSNTSTFEVEANAITRVKFPPPKKK